MIHVGGLHGGKIYPGTILLSVEEESDSTGAEEVLIRGVFWNNVFFFVELHVPSLEPNGASV